MDSCANLGLLYRSFMITKSAGDGVMGKISSGVTWSVRTYAGAWDACYDESLS